MDGKLVCHVRMILQNTYQEKVVVVNGEREMYNTRAMGIVSLRLTDASKGEPTFASHFVEHAPMTKEEMEEEVNQIMFDITNPYLRRIA